MCSTHLCNYFCLSYLTTFFAWSPPLQDSFIVEHNDQYAKKILLILGFAIIVFWTVNIAPIELGTDYTSCGRFCCLLSSTFSTNHNLTSHGKQHKNIKTHLYVTCLEDFYGTYLPLPEKWRSKLYQTSHSEYCTITQYYKLINGIYRYLITSNSLMIKFPRINPYINDTWTFKICRRFYALWC
jgi:hypothetical protein